MPDLDDSNLNFFLPLSGVRAATDGRVIVPPPRVIEPERGSWLGVFPHTHRGGDQADWSVAFGYGTLYGEYESDRPYIFMQYDSLYGSQWHELAMEDVMALMAQLGAMVQAMTRDAQEPDTLAP